MKPITPSEVILKKAEILPEAIEVWNRLIARKFSGKKAVIKQEDAIEALIAGCVVTRDEVFEQDLLEIEDVYREAGWDVIYDKPAYNEDYSATFTFKKK